MNSYRLPFRHDDAVDIESAKFRGPELRGYLNGNLIDKSSVFCAKGGGELCKERREMEGETDHGNVRHGLAAPVILSRGAVKARKIASAATVQPCIRNTCEQTANRQTRLPCLMLVCRLDQHHTCFVTISAKEKRRNKHTFRQFPHSASAVWEFRMRHGLFLGPA
jgi:hypothetical protein